jgi:hypothetical protein
MTDEEVLQMATIEPRCVYGFVCVKCGEHCHYQICETCRIKAAMRLKGFDISFEPWPHD